jgi:uncharacterized membrane protein (UPF0127 family)
MQGRSYRQLRDAETSRIVVARLEQADTAWKRAVGLLDHAKLEADEGLWLSPCNGIHTFFMRFALDVVFLDRDGVVLRLAQNVRPWRFCGPVRGARTVIELPVGGIARCQFQVGQRLRVETSAGDKFPA